MASTSSLSVADVNHMIKERITQVIGALTQQGMLPHQDKPKPTIETFSKRADTYQAKAPFHDWKKKMLCIAHTVSENHRKVMDEAEKVEIDILKDHIATRSAELQWDHMARWNADL